MWRHLHHHLGARPGTPDEAFSPWALLTDLPQRRGDPPFLESAPHAGQLDLRIG